MLRKGVRIVRLFYFPDSKLIWEFLIEKWVLHHYFRYLNNRQIT